MQRIKSRYNVGDRVFYYDVNTKQIIESKVVNVKRQNKVTGAKRQITKIERV